MNPAITKLVIGQAILGAVIGVGDAIARFSKIDKPGFETVAKEYDTLYGRGSRVYNIGVTVDVVLSALAGTVLGTPALTYYLGWQARKRSQGYRIHWIPQATPEHFGSLVDPGFPRREELRRILKGVTTER